MTRPKLRFYLVLTGLAWLAMDLYAVQGIRTLTRDATPGSGPVITAAYLSVSAGILVAFLYQLRRYLGGGGPARFFSTALNAFLTLVVTRLVFILVLLLEDVYRVVIGIWSVFPERSPAFSTAALLAASVPLGAFLFGVTRGKYHYKVRRVQLEFEDLPAAFDGFRIAQISDVHAGSFDDAGEVARGIALLNRQEPDLFVFTGDLVNHRAEEIRPYLGIFGQIRAPEGKFSVLGNHDYGDYVSWPDREAKKRNLERLTEYHHTMGFRLLRDSHEVIRRGQDRLVILGVENWGTGFGHRGDLQRALGGVRRGDFKILLSHDPTHWDAEVKADPARIHLTLSGHTHGMQFGLEIFGLKWSPVQYRYRNWAGLTGEDGRYLYINRGFGFLGFSGRVGIWPEITILELRRPAKEREHNGGPA